MNETGAGGRISGWVSRISGLKNKVAGNRIFVKHEEEIPACGGGNKVRIAEEHYRQAVLEGKDVMISYGSFSSNLNRAVAELCRDRGLACVVVEAREPDHDVLSRNGFRVRKSGARIVSCEKGLVAETLEALFEELRSEGREPYYVYGDAYGRGGEAVAARAYRKVWREIREQEKRMGIRFDYLFLTTGTGTTQGGLLLGQEAWGGTARIVGISAARKKSRGIDGIRRVLEEAGKARGTDGICPGEILLEDRYLQGGYGKASEEELAWIEKMYREEDLRLDRTYTGKGFYGMVKYLEEQGITGKNILFLHTGGLPLFEEEHGL